MTDTTGAIKGDIALAALTRMGIDDVREVGADRLGTLRAAINRLGLLVDIVTAEHRAATASAEPPPDNVVAFRRGKA